MSSGLECCFFEPSLGNWYYALQDWSCPVGAWDWREHATAYGPFADNEAAIAHLRRNHANPGGWNVTPHAEYRGDAVSEQLIRDARR